MYFVGVWETGPCALCKVTTSPEGVPDSYGRSRAQPTRRGMREQYDADFRLQMIKK